MAKTTEEQPLAEKIEIIDRPDEITEKGKSKSWLTIPLILIVAVLGILFLVRRFNSDEE